MNDASLKELLANQRLHVRGKSFASAKMEFLCIESTKARMRSQGIRIPPAMASVDHRRRRGKSSVQGVDKV